MTNVHALKTRQTTQSALAERATSSFRELLSRPMDAAKGNSIPQGMPARGPYGGQILYLNGGAPHFGAYCETDNLRKSRPFTANSVELRCDALAIAIYLSGFVQYQVNTPEGRISTGNKVSTYGGIRMLAFRHKDVQPCMQAIIKDRTEMLATVHTCFVEMYNDLARTYNISGLPYEWLTLKSSHQEIFPSLTLRLEDAERMLDR